MTGSTSDGVDPQYIKKRRRLALAVERAFIALVNLGRSPSDTPPEASAVRRILVIRHNHLGDAVASSPFIAAIRQKWPAAEVEVLAGPANKDAFAWVDGISAIHVRPRRLLERYQLYGSLRNRYDLVFQTLIDEHYFKRALAARCIAGRGIAVGRKRGSPLERLFDRAIYMPSGSYVGKLMALLTPFGRESVADWIRAQPRHCITLPSAAHDRAHRVLQDAGIAERSYVVLNISARMAFRELGVEQAVRLAEACTAEGLPVVLLHGPHDRQRAEQVAARAPQAVVPPAMELAPAMALAQHARLYLGADTGTAHFAAAGGVPCVVLFADRAKPEAWSPYGVPFASIQANLGQPVSEIDPAVVVEHLNRLLSGETLHRIVRTTPKHYPA